MQRDEDCMLDTWYAQYIPFYALLWHFIQFTIYVRNSEKKLSGNTV